VGPVITSHSGLVAALWLEIFLKRPHEFKIEELRIIRSLFIPKTVERLASAEPFHAGFGNKPTDTKSYREVGENKAISRCFCRHCLHLNRMQGLNSTKFSL
jgi:phosphatidate phosphatase PAH1